MATSVSCDIACRKILPQGGWGVKSLPHTCNFITQCCVEIYNVNELPAALQMVYQILGLCTHWIFKKLCDYFSMCTIRPRFLRVFKI